GCPEDSDVRLKAWARECRHDVRVVRSQTNRGKGHAVRRGLLRARGDYRIFTDVDLAYSTEMIESVAEQLEQGVDVVIASRAHRESEVTHAEGLADYVQKRNRQSQLFSMAVRSILRIGNRDPQAGL